MAVFTTHFTLNKFEKLYFLEYTDIPYVFLTPHHVGHTCTMMQGHCCIVIKGHFEQQRVPITYVTHALMLQ
jgi:hypothetical protein